MTASDSCIIKTLNDTSICNILVVLFITCFQFAYINNELSVEFNLAETYNKVFIPYILSTLNITKYKYYVHASCMRMSHTIYIGCRDQYRWREMQI